MHNLLCMHLKEFFDAFVQARGRNFMKGCAPSRSEFVAFLCIDLSVDFLPGLVPNDHNLLMGVGKPELLYRIKGASVGDVVHYNDNCDSWDICIYDWSESFISGDIPDMNRYFLVADDRRSKAIFDTDGLIHQALPWEITENAGFSHPSFTDKHMIYVVCHDFLLIHVDGK